MFSNLEQQITGLASIIPLPVFVVVASFIEEVVAPIPSPFVLLVAGSIARIQDLGLLAMCVLVQLATLGKTLGALSVYGIVGSAKTSILNRYPNFFGITEADLASLRARLTGTSRDYFLLTLLRALPIVPSVLLSAGGGMLKIPLRLFIISTILGTIVRDAIYLYVGYIGTQTLVYATETASHAEKYVLLGVAIVLGFLLFRVIQRRRKSTIPTPEV